MFFCQENKTGAAKRNQWLDFLRGTILKELIVRTQMDSKVWQSRELVEKYLKAVGVAYHWPLSNWISCYGSLIKLGKWRIFWIWAQEIEFWQTQSSGAQGVLVDFSQPMLAAAREKLVEYENLIFLQLDYRAPLWYERMGKHAPFSAVVSGFSIHHQPDS